MIPTPPTQPTISAYLQRLCDLQVECLPESVSFPGSAVTSDDPVYWTNHLAGVSYKQQDPSMSSHVLTLEVLLTRDPITAGLDLEVEAKCQADIFAVLDYFAAHTSLTGDSGLLREPLRGIVPNSLTITSQGVADVPRGSQNHLGSSYTITFAINRWKHPR